MKKIAIIVIILMIIVAMVAFLLFNMRTPPEPKDFVSDRTFENFSTMFFEYNIFRYPSNLEIKYMDTSVENITLGVVTDSWNINFGVIPGNGTSVQRNIMLDNKNDKDSKITLKTYGNISSMVSFSKNDFVLKSNERASIDISLNTSNSEYGNYTGEIDVVIQKAIYNFLPIV